jgi:hypothetical protein
MAAFARRGEAFGYVTPALRQAQGEGQPLSDLDRGGPSTTPFGLCSSPRRYAATSATFSSLLAVAAIAAHVRAKAIIAAA